MYDCHRYSANVCKLGGKRMGASLMPSLPSLPSPIDDNSSLQYNNNTSDLNTGLEQKEVKGIKFTPDYDAGEPIFWRVFEELSNQSNGLVDYYNLQERLLTTGKFYAGEAVLMIDHMEKIGKIEQTGDYHVYRRKKPASPE